MTHEPAEMPAGEAPPLTTGMRMDRETFHRVYCLHPEIKKAELIGGVVYVASPVSGFHADPHFRLAGWMNSYCDLTPHVEGVDNMTLILSSGVEVQPDIVLFRPPLHGGNVRYSGHHYLTGSPELVAEIAVSTEAIDTGPKLEEYRLTGVREYIIWRALFQQIDWYVLRAGQFELLPMDDAGIVRSGVFPGLWLDVPAMLASDRAGVLATLRAGVAARP